LESGEVKEAVGGIKWVFDLAKKGEVFDVIRLEKPNVSTRAMFGRFLDYEDVGGAIEGDNLAFEFVAQHCADRKQTPHGQFLGVVVVAVATLHYRAFCSFLHFPPTLPFLPPNKDSFFLHFHTFFCHPILNMKMPFYPFLCHPIHNPEDMFGSGSVL